MDFNEDDIKGKPKTIWQHFIEEKDETERDFKSLMETDCTHAYIHLFTHLLLQACYKYACKVNYLQKQKQEASICI